MVYLLEMVIIDSYYGKIIFFKGQLTISMAILTNSFLYVYQRVNKNMLKTKRWF